MRLCCFNRPFARKEGKSITGEYLSMLILHICDCHFWFHWFSLQVLFMSYQSSVTHLIKLLLLNKITFVKPFKMVDSLVWEKHIRLVIIIEGFPARPAVCQVWRIMKRCGCDSLPVSRSEWTCKWTKSFENMKSASAICCFNSLIPFNVYMYTLCCPAASSEHIPLWVRSGCTS